MRTRFIILVSIFLLLGEVQSQFVQIGNGNFLGTAGGPLITRNSTANYQTKFAYIFPKSVLGNMKHGDSLASLSFYRSAGDSFTGRANLQIWLDNTQNDDWGTTPISFNFMSNAAHEVYSNHPNAHIGVAGEFYELPFSKTYVFDTTKGNNLAMFVYYEQGDTVKGNIRFYFEGANSVSGYYSPQVRYSMGTSAEDSLRIVTEYHPTVRFSFPRENEDLDMLKLYTLGKLPVPLGNPDSVKVLIRNVGKKDVQALKCYTNSKGANQQNDSFYVSLKKGKEAIFNVPSLSPNTVGTDTIFVSSSDNNTSNNLVSSLRWANENIYSYRDISLPPAAGGIGFNGAQGDFVARFQSNQPKNLNQISVAFSGTGRLFKLGIWDFDSTRIKPGKLLWESDSLTTRGGTYIYDLPQSVKVNGSFYVGVRQLDLNNVAFGYQMEQPVRPQTFFYAVPLGDTNWIDFHPGAPYKFIIEPRLQADYDVVANAINFPKDTFNVYDNDTVAPVAKISNIGVENIVDSVRIRCIIRGPATVVYDETLYDSIASGVTKNLSFPRTFMPKQFGNHTVTLFVSYYKDQVVDNDTFVRTLVVGCERDVMIRNAFPTGTGTFIARVDTIQPITTIMNLAYRNSGAFNITSQFWTGDSLKSSETQTLQLNPLGSQILVWKEYPTNDTGKLRWIVFTALNNDEYTLNDTAIFTGIVYKTIDVGPQAIFEPDTQTNYLSQQKIEIKTRIYNQGVSRADKVKAIFEIYKPNGQIDYKDSLIRDINPRNYINYNFTKSYFPQEKGIYKTLLYIADSNDLYRENDTLRSYFYVGRPVDYFVDSISLPQTMSTDPVGMRWSVLLGNLGYDNTLGSASLTANITRNNVNWFNETQNLKVASDSVRRIEFSKRFRPMFTGTYEVEVVVNHPKEVHRINDTIRSTVQVRIGKDALVRSISAPNKDEVFYIKDVIDDAYAHLWNQGNDSLKNVVVYNVWTFEKAILYQSTDTLDFAPGDSIQLHYPVKIQFNQAGKGFHRVWLHHPGDEDLSNDTITHFYTVRSKRDLQIRYVDSPSRNMSVFTDYKMYPIVTLVNQANDSAVIPGNLVLNIKQNGNEWYSENIPYPGIEPGDSVTIQATQAVYFTKEANYELLCFAENNFDDNAENDTFSFNFQVSQNNIKQQQQESVIVFPNPTHTSSVLVRGVIQLNEFKMVDILGREVSLEQERVGQDYLLKWNEEIPQGTYFLFINQQQQNTSVRIIAD